MIPVTMSIHVLLSCSPATELTVTRLAIVAMVIPFIHMVVAVIVTEEGFITSIAFIPDSPWDQLVFHCSMIV